MGAALERSIQWFNDIVNKYPQDFESVFESYVETLQIKHKAKLDGTFMLAPNGKPTNLTERQWLQVRTTSFKNWFGDWENDPENASKVVDENGEPKMYYHHTNAVFTEFLHDKKGKTDAGWLGSGFYFYGIEDEGKGYGRNVMACFLNVREPYYASDEDMFRLSEADNIEESEAFTEELKESGYDGVYYDGDLRQEMLVFEPEQIKSATANRGTFDANNPDITFSISPARARRKYMPLQEAVKLEQYIAMETYARKLYRDALSLAQANPKNKLIQKKP